MEINGQYVSEWERRKDYVLRTRGQRSCEVTVLPRWIQMHNLKPTIKGIAGDQIVSEIQEDGTLLLMTAAQRKARLDSARAGA